MVQIYTISKFTQGTFMPACNYWLQTSSIGQWSSTFIGTIIPINQSVNQETGDPLLIPIPSCDPICSSASHHYPLPHLLHFSKFLFTITLCGTHLWRASLRRCISRSWEEDVEFYQELGFYKTAPLLDWIQVLSCTGCYNPQMMLCDPTGLPTKRLKAVHWNIVSFIFLRSMLLSLSQC